MAEETQVGRNGYVKKETMLVVTLITLLVGFLGGVTYSAFTFEERSSIPSQQTFGHMRVSEEQNDMIRSLEKETSQNPENVEAWTELGNLYFDTNRFQKAIQAYKRSLELNHNNPDVWTDLGVMYRRSDQPRDAVEAFDKAIDIDPNHEVSRFNKGIVLLHDLNDREGALAAWGDLLKLNPLAKAPNGQTLMEIFNSVKKEAQ